MLLEPNEKTALIHNGVRHFKKRKRNVRQFQCLMYLIFVSFLITVLVIIISKVINSSSNLEDFTLINETFPTLFFLWPVPDKNISVTVTDNDDLWKECETAGKIALKDREEKEENTPLLKQSSPSYKHQKVFLSSERSRNYSLIGYMKEVATKYYYDKTSTKNITQVCHKNENRSFTRNFMSRNLQCDRFIKYRSYNGSCNNLLYPNEYGVSLQKFRRALPPNYSDGISEPRKSSTGENLPSARTVSNVVHRSIQRNDPKFTIMLTVWGQFIDHDITATALTKGVNGSSIACCVPNPHPECYSVILDENDPYYKYYNITCMEFIRSATAPSSCLGPREQMTQTSAFIDGSVIYGPDEMTNTKLREFNGGRLKMLITKDNRTLLPVSNDLNDGCNRWQEIQKGRYCFMTGDSRANENIFLTSMHLIWARQHNTVANDLSKINPYWNDERIFQEARKIIGAQMQYITYNEFLPIILGENIMRQTKLLPKRQGYFNGYNRSVDPSIANNFATATFRFAHSLLPTLIKISTNSESKPEYLKLHQILFNPFKLYNPGELDDNIKGAMQTSIEANDPYFSEQLKHHLFEEINKKENKTCGLDLVSLNIQRGRDHGLPSYINWRQHCALKTIKSFDELQEVFDKESFKNIRKVYKNFTDIDMYTGGLSERQLPGSILGPTFTCLLIDQFVRLKIGDRFWHENPFPEGFTEDQLQQIRKTTLAKVLCDNSDKVDSIPKKVMERIGKSNKFLSCHQIPKPELIYWKTNE